MLRILAAAILLGTMMLAPVAPGHARATEMATPSAWELARRCDRMEEASTNMVAAIETAFCAGYLMGFVENDYLSFNILGRDRAPYDYCLPDPIEGEEVRQIFMAFVKNNEEKAKEGSARAALGRALLDVFPCEN